MTRTTAKRIADAVTVVINETPAGASGGALYSALMEHISIDDFNAMMRVLVEAKRVTKEGDRYFPGPTEAVAEVR